MVNIEEKENSPGPFGLWWRVPFTSLIAVFSWSLLLDWFNGRGSFNFMVEFFFDRG